MAKEAYYFSHDSNARQDEKILMLRAEHSWEGYGIYWALIEMMFESGDTALHHNKIKGIAVSYNIDITLLQQVINTCIAEQLFTSDNEKFWSESLIRRKLKFQESKEKKSEAGKKGMAKRYGKQQNANGVITEPNKVKESKEKESKGKEITQVHVPVFDNPHNDRIETYLKKYKVEYIIMQLEDICSFVGAVSLEVIEYSIASSEGKSASYAIKILKRLLSEGKTEIEQVNPKPKVGDNVVQFGEGIRQGFTNEHDRPYEEQPEWQLPAKYRDPETKLPDVSGH
jgi:uncharacterized protein YdaU (DUF1376 family)